MKKILIVAEGVSNAHPTRMSLIAEECVRLGYDTLFATNKNFLPMLNYESAFHHLDSVDVKVFSERLFNLEFPYLDDELKKQHVENLALLTSFKPDVIFSDFRLNLDVLAKKHSIPFVNVTHTHWLSHVLRPLVVPYVKPVVQFGRMPSTIFSFFMGIFKRAIYLRQANRIRRFIDLPPAKNFYDIYSEGDIKAIPEYEECSRDRHDEDINFIGPLIWRPKKKNEKIEVLASGKKIFVGLGSTGNDNFIPSIISTCLKNDFVVICATPMTPEIKKLMENYKDRLIVKDFVPLDSILDVVDLVICNGGSGGTNHALSFGVPVLGITFNMDQSYFMSGIKAQGLGDFLYPDEINEKNLNEKIQKLIKKKQFVREWLAKTRKYDLGKSIQAIVEKLAPI